MTKRITALDTFQGIALILMIIVNTPGSWDFVFSPLRHAPWGSWTPADLFFSFFLFTVGAYLYSSFEKIDHQLTGRAIEKIAKRTSAIFLIGLIINAFPKGILAHSLIWQILFGVFTTLWLSIPLWKSKAKPSIVKSIEWLCLVALLGLFLFTLGSNNLRILGIFQRTALSFGLGAFICLLCKGRVIPLVSTLAVILIGYWLLMMGFGDFTLQNNFQRTVDLAVLGKEHMYNGYGSKDVRIPFEPQGLLGTLPSIGTIIIGFLAGQIMNSYADNKEAVKKLLMIGVPLIGLAYLWNIWFPINRALWTSSYVLLTGGLAMIVLGIILYLSELNDRWTHPFVIFSYTPILIFALSIFVLILSLSSTPFEAPTGRAISPYQAFYIYVFGFVLGDNHLASLVFALFFVFVLWIIAYIIYKRRLFVLQMK